MSYNNKVIVCNNKWTTFTCMAFIGFRSISLITFHLVVKIDFCHRSSFERDNLLKIWSKSFHLFQLNLNSHFEFYDTCFLHVSDTNLHVKTFFWASYLFEDYLTKVILLGELRWTGTVIWRKEIPWIQLNFLSPFIFLRHQLNFPFYLHLSNIFLLIGMRLYNAEVSVNASDPKVLWESSDYTILQMTFLLSSVDQPRGRVTSTSIDCHMAIIMKEFSVSNLIRPEISCSIASYLNGEIYRDNDKINVMIYYSGRRSLKKRIELFCKIHEMLLWHTNDKCSH